MQHLIRHAATGIIDAVLPPRCGSCGDIVRNNAQVCARCWQTLTFIAAPFCRQCGLPFEIDPGDEGLSEASLCGHCIATPPAYAQARAALIYDEAARQLLLAFKHGDRTDLTATFARWLAQAGRHMLHPDCVLVPVPLNRRRLLYRRYNQAALLANRLAALVGCHSLPDLLLRVKATPSQGGLSRQQRFDNVSRAFAVREDGRRQVQDRPIVVIDDVMTTGATLDACARRLHQAGFGAVAVLTVARAVISQP